MLGIDVADLIAAASTGTTLVTLADWIADITPTFTASTAATYRPYWWLATRLLGDRGLAELTTADLAAVVDAAAERARTRNPDSSGRASRETCVAALRAVYARAVDAGYLTVNPAAGLSKPSRARSRRRALAERELADLVDAVRTTTTDPDLDLALIRFHLETGARRQGAINLRIRDLDGGRATVWLREKNDTEREQPASPSLVAHLHSLASARGAARADDAVFRTRRGEPITGRRYDTLFSRARTCLNWDDRTPVSAHVLRHTAITAIARSAGYPVAQAFAGHAPATVTGRYLYASLAEIATAVAAYTGEAHPLAHEPERPTCERPSGYRPR